MSYRLVISEKPSVAMSYAKILGATSRQDGYLEGNGYLVSWCVGHLVELAPPSTYGEQYVKWSVADLPILPEKWQYLVSASTKKQFKVLKDLMNRPDVDSIVCGTDAGREGELIFRLVYQQAGCKKPFSRLWISSMENSAIREGFAHLRPSTEYDALYNAALCRERADWMVGINCSRLFSCLYGQPLAVGRVMTPVLAMTVVREAAIAAFVPEKFYTVALSFAGGGTASSKRFQQKADAEILLENCRKEEHTTVQKVERKEKTEKPPQLYDLTSLQRDANRLLGFTAQQTLTYTQSLYEKKLITYPRTDSRFLTEDMAASLPGLVMDAAGAFGVVDTQEGEQRFDNHTDKLLNYIRFWQADGESEKTSVRTRTSLRQLVEEGHFKGGNAPYGYDLTRSGRTNKRKHELYELHINEQEAAVVRLIFDKYVYEGYGPQHIATYLNDAGYRARSGKCWHPSSIRGMVQNLTYTGVLRCGDARSELMPELQIIPEQQFETAQRIRDSRSVRAAADAEHRTPLNIHGKSLLSGNAYCGHCGAKLELTSSRKWRKLADGSLDDTLRIRYTCYGKLRKQTECTGQTGYTVHILDEIIDKAVRQIFSKMRGIPKEQIITKRYEKETTERKNHLQDLQTQRDKAEKDLLALKAEVLACIKGESALPRETLAEMIKMQEEKLKELETLCESASEELERKAELMDRVSKLYDELISYADLYDSANFEAKKMIVNQLIRRVDVYRGYQINISFNFDLTPYIEGE